MSGCGDRARAAPAGTLMMLIVVAAGSATSGPGIATAAAGQTAGLGAPAAPAASAPAASVPVAGAPVEDIRDIRGLRTDSPEWVLPAVVGAATLLALLGYGLWRRRRRAVDKPSPLEQAERRLEAIRALMTPAGAPRFAIEVSAVVREYSEQRFGVGATLLTSEEFVRRMLASSDPTLARQRARLLEFLRRCDLAKFAGERLTLDAMESLHADARSFVRETAGREETNDALPAT